MKLKRLLLLSLLVASPSFAYQQQGFSNYQENGSTVDFVCENQCVLVLDSWKEADVIRLVGQLEWQWMLWYGFLIGQQIAPGESLQVNGNGNLNTEFIIADSPVFKQLPSEYQLVILVQGNVIGKNISISSTAYSLFQGITQWWNDFWKMETLTPYSINLRYGVMIWWTSLVQYGYILFILGALFIFFFVKWTKEEKYRRIFFLGIGMFLFIGIRNLITYWTIVSQWLSSYTSPSLENKTFFDLGDYIPLTVKIRDILKLDTEKKTCKIHITSFQDRPFVAHRQHLYLKPCVVVQTWSEADYLLYYNKPLPNNDLTKSVLLQFHGSTLLLNK